MISIPANRICALLFALSAPAGPASAQEIPADYKAILTTLGKSGDFKDGVLKVNISPQ